MFSGEATYDAESGKMKYFYSDNLAFQSKAFIERMTKMDWSFADKYFTEPVNDIVRKIVPKNSIYLTKKKLDDVNKKLAGKLSQAAKEKTREAIDKVKGKVSDAYSSGLKHAEKKLRREVVKKIEKSTVKNNNKDMSDEILDKINSLPKTEKMGKGNKVPVPRVIKKPYVKNPTKKRKIPHKPDVKKDNGKRASYES